MAAWLWTHQKPLNLKWLSCVLCELYVNKANATQKSCKGCVQLRAACSEAAFGGSRGSRSPPSSFALSTPAPSRALPLPARTEVGSCHPPRCLQLPPSPLQRDVCPRPGCPRGAESEAGGWAWFGTDLRERLVTSPEKRSFGDNLLTAGTRGLWSALGSPVGACGRALQCWGHQAPGRTGEGTEVTPSLHWPPLSLGCGPQRPWRDPTGQPCRGTEGPPGWAAAVSPHGHQVASRDISRGKLSQEKGESGTSCPVAPATLPADFPLRLGSS